MKTKNVSLLHFVTFFCLSLPLTQAISSGNETDMMALLKFKAGIVRDPHGIFNSWNDSLPFCQWYGIICSRRHNQRVTSMVLIGWKLVGSISPYIGNLSFLRNLNLRNNSFNGRIPEETGNLFRLQQLFVNNNTMEGAIPVNLTRCSQLKILDLSWNNLAGKIPVQLGSLARLEILQISANNLMGEIPATLGNLSSLAWLSATRNHLEGSIPDELSRLTSLTRLAVGQNRLSGTIPSSLFNISSLELIATAQNQLKGILPSNIGLTLPNLQQAAIGENMFYGSIPNSLCNASKLEILDLTVNHFTGQVPICLGNLQGLWWLNVGTNNLGTNSTSDLAFLTSLKNCSNLKYLVFNVNNLGGVLPDSVANLSVQLTLLLFGYNQIAGTIPEALGNFINLIALDMGNNLFHGVVPFSVGKLHNLQRLNLEGNRLSGLIPSSVGNLTVLYQISIAKNKLEGTIPESIGNCQKLQYLDFSENNINGLIPNKVLHLSSLSLLLNLSHNSLTGNLSSDVGKLTSVNTLDISENLFSGEIPGTVGGCLSLEYMYMQGNSFQGTIPSLASLKGLQKLDLSRNHLTGEIPKDLQSLGSLLYLNLSFNNLVGEIPTGGVFKNVSAFSLVGNKKLCGGVPELHQPKCRTIKVQNGKSIALVLAITVFSLIFCVMLIAAFVLVSRRRRSEQKLSDESQEINNLVTVSYRDLSIATERFSTNNLVGSGGFGSVYKGFLKQIERHVAIKVLKLETEAASKSFLAECKVLRTVRHRNLVKLLTCCSSIDHKGNEFKALVFEFMANGSLDEWLHCDINGNSWSPNLSFLQRLNIAIDVASALHYLHDLCENPVIHCDLKPRNVLLDDDMVARLGDFGLARLYTTTTNDGSRSQTSSLGIGGTIGYTPPEYGLGATASKEGDVYSYGILVLELFTGKRPTDKIFQHRFNLHGFVKNALPERLEETIDPNLRFRERKETAGEEVEEEKEEEGCLLSCEIQAKGGTNNHEKPCPMSATEKGCLLSVFKVGVACSMESPQERMHVGDVAKELHLIRSTFLGNRIYGSNRNAGFMLDLTD